MEDLEDNMKTIAQANFGPLSGFGPLGNPEGDGIGTFSNFISSAVGLMTIVAAIWFVFTFFIGAIGIITAGSDKQALEGAKKKITTGIIGFVVVVVAIFAIDLIGILLGFGDVGILNLEAMFSRIQSGN
jgi:hypothetical protein